MGARISQDELSPLLRSILSRLNTGLGEAAKAEVVDAVHDSFYKQFESEGALGATPWPQLARPNASGMMLEDTGMLFASLTEANTPYGYAENRSPWQIAVGTRDPVAHLLASGTRNMPARSPTPDQLAAEDEERVITIVGEYLVTGTA